MRQKPIHWHILTESGRQRKCQSSGQDIIWKERVGANDGCKSAVKDLIRQGCEIIIANSAIYEEAIKSEAEKNPEVDFVVINDSKTQSTVTEDGTGTHKSLQCTYGYLRSFLCGRSHGRNESSKAERKRKRFPQRVLTKEKM